MKNALLCVLLLWSSLSLARDRDWKDAVYLGMTTSTNGVAVLPVGNMMVGTTISGQTYWFKCADMTYAAAFDPMMQWHAPNLTVNAHVKVALDGHSIRILDDDNKDRKLKIVGKYAPKEQQ
jgi:hypothetical protein